MFEKDAEKYSNDWKINKRAKLNFAELVELRAVIYKAHKDGAETTLRKVIKYFSTLNLDENCGGYFSHLLENEEELQELAKELENV